MREVYHSGGERVGGVCNRRVGGGAIYSTDHAELVFERRVRAILLEKPTCETRARDLERSNSSSTRTLDYSNSRKR